MGGYILKKNLKRSLSLENDYIERPWAYSAITIFYTKGGYYVYIYTSILFIGRISVLFYKFVILKILVLCNEHFKITPT